MVRKLTLIVSLLVMGLSLNAQKDVFNPSKFDVVQGLYKIMGTTSPYTYVLFGTDKLMMLSSDYSTVVEYPFVMDQSGTTLFLIVSGIRYIYRTKEDSVMLIPYATEGIQPIHLERMK